MSEPSLGTEYSLASPEVAAFVVKHAQAAATDTMTRLDRAQVALAAYRAIAGPGLSDEELIVDMMTDLLHFADADSEEYDRDAEQMHAIVMVHFEAERGDHS